MIDFIWHSVWAQLSLAALAIVALGAVAWFIPPLRRWAIGAAGIILAAASVYGKGASDARKRERERSQREVDKAKERYDKVDKRADTAKDVEDRLDRGRF